MKIIFQLRTLISFFFFCVIVCNNIQSIKSSKRLLPLTSRVLAYSHYTLLDIIVIVNANPLDKT